LKANNKTIRLARLHHARLFSREANMSDVFFNIMDRSDPVVVRHAIPGLLAKRRRDPLPQAVIELLVVPDVPVTQVTFHELSDDEEVFFTANGGGDTL
jgi:hypothetical protein